MNGLSGARDVSEMRTPNRPRFVEFFRIAARRVRAQGGSAKFTPRAHAARPSATLPKASCCTAEEDAVVQAERSDVSMRNVRVAEQITSRYSQFIVRKCEKAVFCLVVYWLYPDTVGGSRYVVSAISIGSSMVGRDCCDC